MTKKEKAKYQNICPKKSNKQKRRDWWKSLTPEQQEDYIEHKQELKAKKRAITPITNKYPEPIITAKNAVFWRNRILRMNPWLNDLFEPRINFLDYQHMQSIKQEIRQENE